MKKLFVIFGIILLTSGCVTLKQTYEDPKELAGKITFAYVLVENRLSEDHRTAVFYVYNALDFALSPSNIEMLTEGDVLENVKTRISLIIRDSIKNKELSILAMVILNRYWSNIERNINSLDLNPQQKIKYLVDFKNGIAETYSALSSIPVIQEEDNNEIY
jgi:hypothetical protein